MMGANVSLLAKKELLENAKFDFRSACRGATECPECHLERFNLIKRYWTQDIDRKTFPWSVLLVPYLFHLTFNYSFVRHLELIRR